MSQSLRFQSIFRPLFSLEISSVLRVAWEPIDPSSLWGEPYLRAVNDVGGCGIRACICVRLMYVLSFCVSAVSFMLQRYSGSLSHYKSRCLKIAVFRWPVCVCLYACVYMTSGATTKTPVVTRRCLYVLIQFGWLYTEGFCTQVDCALSFSLSLSPCLTQHVCVKDLKN